MPIAPAALYSLRWIISTTRFTSARRTRARSFQPGSVVFHVRGDDGRERRRAAAVLVRLLGAAPRGARVSPLGMTCACRCGTCTYTVLEDVLDHGEAARCRRRGSAYPTAISDLLPVVAPWSQTCSTSPSAASALRACRFSSVPSTGFPGTLRQKARKRRTPADRDLVVAHAELPATSAIPGSLRCIEGIMTARTRAAPARRRRFTAGARVDSPTGRRSRRGNRSVDVVGTPSTRPVDLALTALRRDRAALGAVDDRYQPSASSTRSSQASAPRKFGARTKRVEHQLLLPPTRLA